MPTLPTYQSKAQLQQVQQPNIGRQFGVGDVVGAIGQNITRQDERQKAQLAFQQKINEVNAKNQIGAAKIENKNYNDLLLEEFTQDPTGKEEGWFEEQQVKNQQELANEIENPIARGKFLLESSRDITLTGIKARGVRASAVINESERQRIDKYLVNRDERAGDRVGNIYEIAKEALEDKMLPNKDAANKEVWENIVGLAVYDAEKSPQDAENVLQSLLADDGTYPVEGDYMKEAISSVESIYKRDKKRADLNSSIAGNTAQSEMQAIINDKTLSYEEQWRSIDSHENLTDGQKKTFKKALKSNKNIDPKTDAILLMQYGNKLTDLRNRFGYDYSKKIDPEDAGIFLTNTQKLRDEIVNSYANGELSYENYLGLSSDVDRYSSSKSQQALGVLKNVGEWTKTEMENSDVIEMFGEMTVDVTAPPRLFQNYYTSLKRLENSDDARKQWNIDHPDVEWKDTDDNRAILANEVLNQYKYRERKSAVQLMSRYSGLSVAKSQVTETDFLKQEGRTEADIQKTMKLNNVSREAVLKRMGYGG